MDVRAVYTRYSLQLAVRFKKYYKSLFIGFVDIAIVNAFIVYKAKQRATNPSAKVSHVKFMKELHTQLVQLDDSDMEDFQTRDSATPVSSTRLSSGHSPAQVEEWRPGNKPGEMKRRQRACKVCSILKEERKRAAETTWYCDRCTLRRLPVFLCIKARRNYRGQMRTCFDIWHNCWQNGNALPAISKKRKIRARQGGATEDQESKAEGDGDGSDTDNDAAKRARTEGTSILL
jgi:hypothetical protein